MRRKLHLSVLAGLSALFLAGAIMAAAQDQQPSPQTAAEQPSPEAQTQAPPQALPPDPSDSQDHPSQSVIDDQSAQESAQPQTAPPQRSDVEEQATRDTPVAEDRLAHDRPTVDQAKQSESSMDADNTQLTDATASIQAKFDALDTDHDGSIDANEAAASDVLAAQFKALDIDGDGKLSLAEFTTANNLASIRIDHRRHE
jgi:hypothetical protein